MSQAGGTYPLYYEGRACGCYGDVLPRQERVGIPWKPCPLHAQAEAMREALKNVSRAADLLLGTAYGEKLTDEDWAHVNAGMAKARALLAAIPKGA